MDRHVGVGVIGLGWMGRVHAAAFGRVRDHFPALGLTPRLVVASDVSADRRAHAEHIGFERTVEDWRAVVDDAEVEAVSITTPNAMHREIALAAIEAGKHIWVEKPVGRGFEDASVVADAA
ncbi:MAG TPA: Gfo/Idh/MocA family oxidoreductase, partial [Thermoleophilaceae bacterium]|nr:Gfo/Idh/MocA family oxidoreductase [Thermoleophilaceae bacterium]